MAEECLEIALILMLLLVPQKKWDCERLNTTLEKVSKPSFEVRRQKSVVSQLLSASVSSHHNKSCQAGGSFVKEVLCKLKAHIYLC